MNNSNTCRHRVQALISLVIELSRLSLKKKKTSIIDGIIQIGLHIVMRLNIYTKELRNITNGIWGIIGYLRVNITNRLCALCVAWACWEVWLRGWDDCMFIGGWLMVWESTWQTIQSSFFFTSFSLFNIWKYTRRYHRLTQIYSFG